MIPTKPYPLSSVSHKWPHPSALHPCYIRSFVILTPFFPPHPTPCCSSCPILLRHCILSTRSLSPPPELIKPSIPGVTTLPTLRGLDDDEPTQEHFRVIPNSLMLNLHELSAYTSQTPHAWAPFFLLHRLGDYDRSTDIISTLYSCHSDQIVHKNSVSTASHVNNDFRFPPIPQPIQFHQRSLLASKSTLPEDCEPSLTTVSTQIICQAVGLMKVSLYTSISLLLAQCWSSAAPLVFVDYLL